MPVETIRLEPQQFKDGNKGLCIAVDLLLDDVMNSAHLPAFLKNGLEIATTWQERCEYSVMKSIHAPALAPQWIEGLLVLDAWLITEDAAEIKLADFLNDKSKYKGQTFTELKIPLEVNGQCLGMSLTGSTGSDEPIVSTTVGLILKGNIVEQARIALSGVWKKGTHLVDLSLLHGKSLTAESIEEAALAVEQKVEPESDYKGSLSYRKNMARLMTRRALERCLKGANR